MLKSSTLPFVLRTLILLAALAWLQPTLQGQCSGGTAAGALTPAPAAAFQTMAVTSGNYYTFVVAPWTGCSGPSYTFSFCAADGGSAGFDTQITILDNVGAYAGGYSDDNCGLQSRVVWTPPTAGTYRVLINTYYCGAGGSATLAYRVTAPPAGSASFELIGSTTEPIPGSGCVQLTPNATGQIGCAWDKLNTLNFLANFSYDFTVNLGSNPAGADGLCFVMQNAPAGRCACGGSGGSMGAAGITNSVIVEIDTYLNYEDRDDGLPTVVCSGGPEPDHLDLWLNGVVNPTGTCPAPAGTRVIPAAIPLMNGGLPYELENGLDHMLRISWTAGSPGTFTATLLNAGGTVTYGTVSYNFTALTVFGTNTPYFGFTASTGGLSNQQSACFPNTVLVLPDFALEALPQDGDIALQWQLPAHLQQNTWLVERMADGQRWDPIAKLDAATALGGSWLDEHPFTGENTYRLKANVQGNELISNIVTARVGLAASLMVYPNPAHDVLHVSWDNEQPVQATLLDLGGRRMLEQTLQSGATLSLEGLANGFYLLEARQGQEVYRVKVAVE